MLAALGFCKHASVGLDSIPSCVPLNPYGCESYIRRRLQETCIQELSLLASFLKSMLMPQNSVWLKRMYERRGGDFSSPNEHGCLDILLVKIPNDRKEHKKIQTCDAFTWLLDMHVYTFAEIE